MARHQRFRDVKQGKSKPSDSQSKKAGRSLPVITTAPIATRVKAFITDTFMLLMPIMYAVAYLVMGSLQEFADHKLEGWIYILIPNFIVVFLFFWRSAQTPGCRAYEIKLVDSRTGGRAHPLALALRYYFELLSFITVLGLLMAFFRKDRKCLHDLLSGTVLVTTKS